MGHKFAIFILLWISLTLNLESNKVYSYFLTFYFFFANVTLFCLFLTKWEYFDKLGKKEQNTLASL